MLTSNSRGSKPRVLLADDHAHMLESASRLLSNDFHVVSAVSDGRQAVDAAQRLDPDVIVLDVAMPELDGFQTVHKLRTVGSRAPIVFLTMYRTDQYILAALRSGVRGYVLKTRMSFDLVAAVHHTLAGRLFVPSLTALASSTSGGGHAAHFHSDNRHSLEAVSGFVRASLQVGEPVVVVGTEATRLAIARHVQSRGMDLRAMERRRQYVALDAVQSLAGVMRGDRPDGDRLAETVDGLERSRLAFANGPQSRLTVFGEMAVPLCRTGNVEAALEIEQIWNRLTGRLPIYTVCSYPIACFQNDRAHAQLSSVCSEHHAISHTLNS
jgi:DNA-binding NarL/FixJ family response regulator